MAGTATDPQREGIQRYPVSQRQQLRRDCLQTPERLRATFVRATPIRRACKSHGRSRVVLATAALAGGYNYDSTTYLTTVYTYLLWAAALRHN